MFGYLTGFDHDMFDQLERVNRQMDQLFGDRYGSSAGIRSMVAGTYPAINVGASQNQVDICEDGNEITVKADLPGVSRDRLNIQIDGNNLAIEAQAAISMPEGMEALYADLKTTRFRRSFTLSNELETDKINADMKDGVLTLHLPKRAELQPRKIEVSAG